MAKPRNVNYKLSDYVHHKVIESTSTTLLRLVSSLVPGGTITKPSVTAQCIQQHVGGTSSNQTMLGLSMKLHHKHGSSEMVKTLNKHGITSSYDEVLRFRKSVAKFVSDNQSDIHKKLGLSMEIGPIFSWADNYDLYIASPNGIKATHAMVMEFTQHPTGIIETGNIGVMLLTIPRLKKHEASSLLLTHHAIHLEHYMGRSKLHPPLLQMKALSAEESQLQSAAVRFSQQRDAAWLSQVHQNDKPVERAGFNAQQDPVLEGPGNMPKTLVVFGPMIDSPPAHPDTVMTTLVYLQRTLNAFGMQYIHVSVDLQLYHTIERPSALDRHHTSPMHDAHSHEFPGLHRNIDEIIWRGGSYERSVWLHHQHHQWEGLDQCSTGISSYNRCVAAEFLLKLARRHTRS